MKGRRKISGMFGALGLFILILDSKTAMEGCQEGLRLCLQTVIPALFPFFVVSAVVCKSLLGENIPLLRPLGKLCKIPTGAESLLLLGFLGGYPVGAKNIVTAEQNGALSKDDAKRMLGFCNNAGPAFLFGMTGNLFENRLVPWFFWLIHILAALVVGCILPGKPKSACKMPNTENINIIKDIENSIRTMANVCAWVVLFRVILSFCHKWLFFYLSTEICVWILGLTELSNGIIGLQAVSNEGLRFILCAGLLGFGGLCVAMQTVSITGKLGTGYYFPGKMIQGCLSVIIAYLLQFLLFDRNSVFTISVNWMLLPLMGIGMSLFIIYPRKNNSRNLSRTYV